MKYNNKKSLYESIMQDVAKIVKQHINENNNTNVWSASVELDEVTHLMYGISYYDIDEYEEDDDDDDENIEAEVKKAMKYTIDDIKKSHLKALKAKKITVDLSKRGYYMTFGNITEDNLIWFAEFLINDVLGSFGDVYESDFYSCIPTDDILETLEDTNPNLAEEFEKLMEDNLFH